MLLVGVGLGLTLSPTNTDAERSQASGVIQTVRQVGGTLGVAVIGGAVLSAFALAALAGALLLRNSPRRGLSTSQETEHRSARLLGRCPGPSGVV